MFQRLKPQGFSAFRPAVLPRPTQQINLSQLAPPVHKTAKIAPPRPPNPTNTKNLQFYVHPLGKTHCHNLTESPKRG